MLTLSLSNNAQQMVIEQAGYRTETYGGSLVRALKDVVRHEISMGNTDILAFVQINHGDISFDVEMDYIDSSNLAQENADFFTEKINELACNKLQSENLSVVWLTTYENVKRLYGGEENDIDKCHIGRPYLILSDLGEDGALFVF